MQFLMLVVTDSNPDRDPTAAPSIEDWGRYVDANGHWVAGNRLHPADQARTVRVRGGDALVEAGPFATTQEQIVGVDVLECAGLDEAVEIAKRHPNAYSGRIELRPVWPLGED